MLKSNNSKNQSGQALLVVLLAMAVILTVVLSISSRSIVDITTTSYEEEALRAFSAAEAGVEEALLKQIGVSETLDPSANVGFEADLTNPLPGSTYNYPESMVSGEIATFWFVAHNNTTSILTCASGDCTRATQLRVCWGNGSGAVPAAEISIFYDPTRQAFASPNTFGGLEVIRLTRDPLASRRSQNNFDSASTGCPFTGTSGNYSYQTILDFGSIGVPCASSANNCLVMANIRMLYNDNPQPVGIRIVGGSGNLPAQGYEIDSTGTAGESVRNLKVVRTYPEPLSVFESAIFSRNDLTKS